MEMTKERAFRTALRLLEIQSSTNYELKAIGLLLAAMLMEREEDRAKTPGEELAETPPAASAEEVASLAAKFLSEPTPESFANLREATGSWLGGSS